MSLKLALFASIAAVSAPAIAGVAEVPSPEIGAGIAAMALIGTGYAFLRRRAK